MLRSVCLRIGEQLGGHLVSLPIQLNHSLGVGPAQDFISYFKIRTLEESPLLFVSGFQAVSVCLEPAPGV